MIAFQVSGTAPTSQADVFCTWSDHWGQLTVDYLLGQLNETKNQTL